MRSLWAIAALVFAIACAAFAIAHSRSQIHPPYPKGDAVGAATRNADVHAALAGGWTRARVIALDRTHWRVTFFDGPRYVVDAAVDPRGRVDATEFHEDLHPSGSTTLWHPAVLLLFTLVFIAAVAVSPLLSLRNLDALVIGAGFTVSALLLDDRLVAAHVYAGSAVLAYAAVRCAHVGLGRAQEETHYALGREQLLRLGALATLVAGAILVVTSTGISDVAFAGLAGGTLLNHGISPYGHITTDVVHGDTYPLLTYVLYMPAAAIAPVRDSFDSLDGALWLNAVALVAGAGLLWRWGVRTALAWLAFPPVLLAASGGGNDVPAAVFAIAAIAGAGSSELSAGLLTLAGWVKIAPAAALVSLLARTRGAALMRSLAVIAAVLAAGLLAMLAIGSDSIGQAVDALRFQFERGSWFSIWRQAGSPAVQVALQAMTVALVAVAVLVCRRDPAPSLRQAAGLAGAVIALVQLSANYWTYAYLPWLLPFILVALFPPARPRSQQPEPRVP